MGVFPKESCTPATEGLALMRKAITSGVAAHFDATCIGYRPVASALVKDTGYIRARRDTMGRGAWNLVAKWRIISDVIACGSDISSMGNDGRVDLDDEFRIDSRTDHCRWLRRYAIVICCWLIEFIVMVCYAG